MNSRNELPLVEPLTEATRQELKPLRLGSRDYCEIWMEDDNAFCMRAVSRMPFDASDPRHLVIPKEQRQTTSTGIIVVPWWSNPGWSARDFFGHLPEATMLWKQDWQRRGEYRVPPTDNTVVMLGSCWPKDRLIFRGPTAHMIFEVALRRFLVQNVRAKLQAEFKSNGTLPPKPEDFTDHGKYPLSDYQRVAMQMGLGHDSLALFMDRGTGKTPVAIARVCLEAKRTRAGLLGSPRMMRVIIVVPNQVRLNWQNEFNKFASTPGKVTVLRGGKLRRIKLLTYAVKDEKDCAFSAVVVGYDTMANDIDALEQVQWDMAICDESHYFKSSFTKRWKAAQRLRDVSTRRMGLTGTPIGNSIMDLYTQLEFLAPGTSGFSNFKAFRSWHGKFEQSVSDGAGNSVSRLVGTRNVPLMQERLARISFAITKDEAGLNLPDKVYDVHEVEMTAKQHEFYEKMRNNLIIKLQNSLSEHGTDQPTAIPKKMMVEHILTQLLRLAQITSGFVRWDEEHALNVETEELVKVRDAQVEQINPDSENGTGNPKIEAVLQMLEESRESDLNEKTIIWAVWREDIRAISSALEKAGIVHGAYYGGVSEAKREEYVHRFNNDTEFKVLVANPQTAGEGLNLLGHDPERNDQETYCGHEIFFSQNWSLIQRSQAEDRAHRRGTKMPVRITDLMVPNTIDEEIRVRVTNKGRQAALIQDVSEILSRVLDINMSSLVGTLA